LPLHGPSILHTARACARRGGSLRAHCQAGSKGGACEAEGAGGGESGKGHASGGEEGANGLSARDALSQQLPCSKHLSAALALPGGGSSARSGGGALAGDEEGVPGEAGVAEEEEEEEGALTGGWRRAFRPLLRAASLSSISSSLPSSLPSLSSLSSLPSSLASISYSLSSSITSISSLRGVGSEGPLCVSAVERLIETALFTRVTNAHSSAQAAEGPLGLPLHALPRYAGEGAFACSPSHSPISPSPPPISPFHSPHHSSDSFDSFTAERAQSQPQLSLSHTPASLSLSLSRLSHSHSLSPHSLSSSSHSAHPRERERGEEGRMEGMAIGMTVFFASPLVMADPASRREVALELLDFEKECRLLQRALRASGRQIGVHFAVATPDGIRQQLTLGAGQGACSVVHLSGHGHSSSLVLEDGFGGAHLLDSERFRDLFAAGGDHATVRLLVVNCCHSAETAQHFVSAGVPHVVASPLQVQDAAAAVFTSSFYLALAVGKSIGAAFQIGTEAVRTSPRLPPNEADKFVLLPKGAPHDEAVWPQSGSSTRRSPPFGSYGGGGCLGMLAPPGTLSSPPLPPAYRHGGVEGGGCALGQGSVSELEFGEQATALLPVAPEDFLGRQFEMHAVCRALRTRRLITLYAAGAGCGDQFKSARAAGIGKTTVAVAVARFLAVRGVYAHGVTFARCTGLADLRGLSRALREALLDHEDAAAAAAAEAAGADSLAWLTRVRNRHSLVVLDAVDAAAGGDGPEGGGALRLLLEAVFERTERLQLVLTARAPLGLWVVIRMSRRRKNKEKYLQTGRNKRNERKGNGIKKNTTLTARYSYLFFFFFFFFFYCLRCVPHPEFPISNPLFASLVSPSQPLHPIP